MLQYLVLPIGSIDNVRMTVANTNGHDPAERIQIPFTALVPNVLHLPFHQHERLFVVEKNSWIQKLLTQTQDFIGRWAVVFFWLIFKRWKLGQFHVGTHIVRKL